VNGIPVGTVPTGILLFDVTCVPEEKSACKLLDWENLNNFAVDMLKSIL
jgi:hypothetical protein